MRVVPIVNVFVVIVFKIVLLSKQYFPYIHNHSCAIYLMSMAITKWQAVPGNRSRFHFHTEKLVSSVEDNTLLVKVQDRYVSLVVV